MTAAAWTIKVERLAIQLAVGVHAEEGLPQPVWVTVVLEGLAPAQPKALAECIDYEPMLRWLKERWPKSSHIPLLETRINEVFEFAFSFDSRVNAARVGLYKECMSHGALAVGIERSTTRVDFEAQCRRDMTVDDTPYRRQRLTTVHAPG